MDSKQKILKILYTSLLIAILLVPYLATVSTYAKQVNYISPNGEEDDDPTIYYKWRYRPLRSGIKYVFGDGVTCSLGYPAYYTYFTNGKLHKVYGYVSAWHCHEMSCWLSTYQNTTASTDYIGLVDMQHLPPDPTDNPTVDAFFIRVEDVTCHFEPYYCPPPSIVSDEIQHLWYTLDINGYMTRYDEEELLQNLSESNALIIKEGERTGTTYGHILISHVFITKCGTMHFLAFRTSNTFDHGDSGGIVYAYVPGRGNVVLGIGACFSTNGPVLDVVPSSRIPEYLGVYGYDG